MTGRSNRADMLSALWARIAHVCAEHPRATIACTIVVVVLVVPGVAFLRIVPDGRALIDPGHDVLRTDAAVKHEFGVRDEIRVVVESDHPDGVFNAETLATVRKLTKDIEVDSDFVTSLAEEIGVRIHPGEGTFRRLLDPLPRSSNQIADLRHELSAECMEPLWGHLVSKDEAAISILVGIPDDRSGSRDETVARIRDVVAQARDGSSDRIYVVGAPVAENLLANRILFDLARLVPLNVAAIGILVWMSSGRLWSVGLVLIEIGCVLAVVFGAMGWLGSPVYLSTTVLPVVLLTVAVTDEMHVFWSCQESSGDSVPLLVSNAVGRVGTPLFLAAITTACGFLSFCLSPIPPLRAFGMFSAIGMVVCFAFSVTTLPALMAFLPEESIRFGRVQRAAPDQLGRRGGWWGVAIAALACCGSALGAFRVEVQDSWIDNFSEDDEFRVATESANTRFLGCHVVLVHVVCEESESLGEGVLDPDRLEFVLMLEEYLDAHDSTGGARGLGALLRAQAAFWETDGWRDQAGVARRVVHRFESTRGITRRRKVVNDDCTACIIAVYLKNANYRDTQMLMDDVEAFGRRNGHSKGVRLQFAGDVAVSQALIGALVRSQMDSLIADVVIVVAVIAFFTRSVLGACVAMVPTLVVVLAMFGLMGWVGIPVGVATSMFCVLVVGVSVDFAIFLQPGLACGAGGPTSATYAAVFADAVALSAGFAVFGVSSIPANRSLGVLLSFGLLASCAVTCALARTRARARAGQNRCTREE